MARTISSTINETKSRINNLPGIPYHLKEQFYRGIAKKELAEEMIEGVKIELQKIDKWEIKKGRDKN